MLFGRYEFSCRFETDAELPHYKGSTFRGVFGRALKKTVCALKQKTCEDCILRTTCVYVRVFETHLTQNTADPRMAARPHPFVIEPPLAENSHYQAGDLFVFTLLLMGEANDLLPYFIYAFEQMGHIGIGRKIHGCRGRFILEKVRRGETVMYTSADRSLNRNIRPVNLLLQAPEGRWNPNGRISLILATPLRLKFQNQLQADLPFHILVRAMLRRVSSLMNAYGEGEPDLDYKRLVCKAEAVAITDNRLSWYDWQRYSFRQDTKMMMGGIIGSVTYEGDLREYLPFLRFCEQVHIGKQTTFGLGMVAVKVVA